jgi:hypothetical protein
VFYAAYVFFEKLRLAEGKQKSKHRLEMEEIWGGKGGFNITRGHSRGYVVFSLFSLPFVIRCLPCTSFEFDDCGDNRYLVMGTDRPVQDQYGRVTIVRGR